MKRREFMALVGGAAAGWPLAAWAQQPELFRRIASLQGLAADDPVGRSSLTVFIQRLQQLGWEEGRNLHLDDRWGGGDNRTLQDKAVELVQLRPEVIFTAGSPGLVAVQRATQSIPIVFVNVADPVGQGFVASLAHPGSNATGFTNFEFGMGGKWLNVMNDVAPRAKRIALVFDPSNPNASTFLRSIETVAASSGIETVVAPIHSKAEIENVITNLANGPVGGLIVLPDALSIVNRQLIIGAAARAGLPTVYPFRDFVVDGGLASYGIKVSENYRQAADYVDRILRGANPADLPVQTPSKFELVINLKTAKALGLTIPQPMLLAADEVIE